MILLKLLAYPAQVGVLRLLVIRAISRFLADVGDTEQLRLCTAAAGGEVEGAVRPHGYVGQRQWCARHELFLDGLVTAAGRFEVHGVHRAEGPVAAEECLLILRGELRAVAELHADRRTGADVFHWRKAIDVVRRPFAGAAAPAELAAADGVTNARRSIPRRAHVPFHVGVVGEQLALGVEGHVISVAVAAADHLPRLAFGIGLGDPAARRQDAAAWPLASHWRGSNWSSAQLVGSRLASIFAGVCV